MSDFFNNGWSIFIAAATLLGLAGCLWLLVKKTAFWHNDASRCSVASLKHNSGIQSALDETLQ